MIQSFRYFFVESKTAYVKEFGLLQSPLTIHKTGVEKLDDQQIRGRYSNGNKTI